MQREAFERHVLPEVEVLLRGRRRSRAAPVDAEDLVQDTLIRAFRAIDSFDGAHPRAWLLTILRNTHINSNRRRRPELLRDPQSHDNVAAPLSDAPDARVERQFDAAVHEALLAPVNPIEMMRQMSRMGRNKLRLATGRPVGPLSCPEVGKVLQGYLDGELDQERAGAIAAHLEDCRRCGLEAETYERIIASVSANRPVVPADQIERLRAFGARLVADGTDEASPTD